MITSCGTPSIISHNTPSSQLTSSYILPRTALGALSRSKVQGRCCPTLASSTPDTFLTQPISTSLINLTPHPSPIRIKHAA